MNDAAEASTDGQSVDRHERESVDPHAPDRFSLIRSMWRWLGVGSLVLAWLPALVVIWTSRPYALDLASHFALHAAAFEVVLALLMLALRRRRAAALLALAAVFIALGSWRHYSPPTGATPDDSAVAIRIVHYNAFGVITRRDQAFLDWLRAEDPDLVCIIDVPWNLPKTSPWIAERYPYRVEPAPGVAWPNLLLSKHPATIQELAPYSEELKFSFVARRSLLVEVPGAEPFVFSALHPPSPRQPWTWELALSMIERDGQLIRDWLVSGGAPVLVSADTNSTPMGRPHRRFSEVSGLRGWTPLVGGGTWPSSVPPWLSLPIDRLWTSDGITVGSMRVGPRFKSDHRAVVARVELRLASERRSNVGPKPAN